MLLLAIVECGRHISIELVCVLGGSMLNSIAVPTKVRHVDTILFHCSLFLVVNVAVCMLLILMREFENDLLYIAFTPEFYASAARWQGIAFRSSDNPSLC